MSQRFFVSAVEVGKRATLSGAEAHHLAHVMRAKPGDLLTLFNGAGWEFSARIESLGRSQVEVTVLEGNSVSRESLIKLTLAAALPKGDRQRWLVEKLVELGVTALVPLITERGVAQPSESAVERLCRTVVEASKQCGRNQLMQIQKPQPWADYLSLAGADMRCFAHPGGKSLSNCWQQPEQRKGGSTVIGAVGPEGGFTDDEVSSAIAAGWQQADLGPRILRVETAALAIAAGILLHDMRC